jgi:exopolysaccharide production protein ExoQ
MPRLNPALISMSGQNGAMVAASSGTIVTSQPAQVGIAAWFVAAMLATAVIGLVHDPNYATARGQEAVEEGRGLDEKAVMEEGLGVAAAGRVIGFALLLGVGGFCIATLPRGVRFRWDALTLLIALALLWTVASCGWSAERGTTLRELARLLVYVGVAAALALRFDLRALMFVLAAGLAGSVATAVAFEIATGGFKPWHSDYRLTGSMHSNILAVQAAVVALIAYAFALEPGKRAAFCWAVFLAAVSIVFLTRARTALATVVAGVAAVHVVGRPARQWMFLASGLATALAVVLIVASTFGLLDRGGLLSVANMGRSDDAAGDLTGRVPLWDFVWHESAGHHLEGFGWGAFWLTERVRTARDALHWFPRHAHNAYLQIVVNIGLIGLAMLVAIGLWSLRRAASLVARTGSTEHRALVAVLAGIIVNGLAESAFAMPRDMGLFAAAAVFSVVVVRQSSELTAERNDCSTGFESKPHVRGALPAKVTLS